MVADCAIYTEQNIKLMSNIKWLSRVPLTIKEAKTLVTTLPESEFIQSKIDGYSSVEKKVSYAGIEQRWLVVQSHIRRKSDLRKLSQNIEKSLKNAEAKLKTLSQERFACSADAMKALSKISKQFKLVIFCCMASAMFSLRKKAFKVSRKTTRNKKPTSSLRIFSSPLLS